MTITNKTKVSLKILGGVLEPEQTRKYPEKELLNIKSNIGECEIKTEYDQRSIKNFGNLKAKEDKKEDEDGMKKIIISATGNN